MRILFTICGRAGSKGFKNKNLKKLRGVPLVHYTLAAIQLYTMQHPNDEIMVAVNTDSPELVSQVKQQRSIKKICFVQRKIELADDIIPKVDVIRDTYLQCLADGAGYDVIVDLDITSPMRRACDIEETIYQMISETDCDLAFSTVSARRNPYFNMVEAREGYFRKVCQSDFTARQQAPAVYELNASIYAFRPAFLQNKIDKTILDYNCRVAIMPDYLVLDIDSEEDFEAMEVVLPFFSKKDPLLEQVIFCAENIWKEGN